MGNVVEEELHTTLHLIVSILAHLCWFVWCQPHRISDTCTWSLCHIQKAWLRESAVFPLDIFKHIRFRRATVYIKHQFRFRLLSPLGLGWLFEALFCWLFLPPSDRGFQEQVQKDNSRLTVFTGTRFCNFCAKWLSGGDFNLFTFRHSTVACFGNYNNWEVCWYFSVAMVGKGGFPP